MPIELMESLEEKARKLKGWWDGEDEEIPPPKLPEHLKPKVPLQAYENMPVRPGSKLTVGNVAAIVANENRDVRPGEKGAEELHHGKKAQAHAIFNGEEQRGENRPRTAPISPMLAGQEQYEEALRATVEALHEELEKTDPTDDMIYFGHTPEEEVDSDRIYDGHRAPVYGDPYGPFTWGKNKRYIRIYDYYDNEENPNKKKE
jgi:hypothetical protein